MEPKPSSLKPLPEEDQDHDQDRLQSDHAPTNAPSAFSSKPIRPPTQTSSQKYSPLDWKGYFDQEDDVCIPDTNDVFHIYTAGKEGPVVFCLHGGGYSGLSFAMSSRLIKEKARVVAMDLRGHGKSSTENEIDMSIETLSSDVLAVLKTMYGDSPPAIVLVGHSMGGSVAVHVAAKKTLRSLAGLVVVDVVEGTAMASLMHMQKILSNRMQYFSTLEKAIEWNVRGGSLRNIESARISIPGTLKYEGLSEKFLSSPVPKLLLLAGTDRLDRALTIGQMQGKFQMVVVRHTGHAIQEDVPEEFASLILNFIARNRIGPYGVEIPGIRRPSQPHGFILKLLLNTNQLASSNMAQVVCIIVLWFTDVLFVQNQHMSLNSSFHLDILRHNYMSIQGTMYRREMGERILDGNGTQKFFDVFVEELRWVFILESVE
ncbi:Alpha/beta hydrolase fold-1 [Cynara cardunculus var. scolymus]|uniref:protein phosphatase methylesterase-1 n=1 Tax=Cynara cardunculus var. scolymus TaxID=59895 RepID=A0A103XTS6_CYNCS|nr:Alpha/beta hydrolase fold-1 [Cynara cardunculus var. scolymus]